MSLQWADLVNDFSKTLQDQTFVNQIYTNQVHIEMQWFPEVYKICEDQDLSADSSAMNSVPWLAHYNYSVLLSGDPKVAILFIDTHPGQTSDVEIRARKSKSEH